MGSGRGQHGSLQTVHPAPLAESPLLNPVFYGTQLRAEKLLVRT